MPGPRAHRGEVQRSTPIHWPDHAGLRLVAASDHRPRSHAARRGRSGRRRSRRSHGPAVVVAPAQRPRMRTRPASPNCLSWRAVSSSSAPRGASHFGARGPERVGRGASGPPVGSHPLAGDMRASTSRRNPAPTTATPRTPRLVLPVCEANGLAVAKAPQGSGGPEEAPQGHPGRWDARHHLHG